MRALCLVCGYSLAFQLLVSASSDAETQSRKAMRSIQDNSFLVEEAYNQEPGVVQHISSLSCSFGGRDWQYTFTEEWPLFGEKHQLGFTLPLERSPEAEGGGTGLGEMALNYRFQCMEGRVAGIWLAPRFTVLLPTEARARDAGSPFWGVQVNVPVSWELSRHLVAHGNAGATNVETSAHPYIDRRNRVSYNLGGSLVWLARPRFNLLFESVWESRDTSSESGATTSSSVVLISPGVRWSHDFDNGLQIVPGLAFPIAFEGGERTYSVLWYLSLEHPF